ncbi:MAG: YggN family protein [candidate division Zixibacteria bacterium]|nr:YggN family protein [candidate division Zixibacteria bacterium]MDH3937576.1 YggN family protein [candidate division Zixibacteria bacterium]MDH4032257.1 YggN family protein [candidate division Zixibacteria bacterium]
MGSSVTRILTIGLALLLVGSAFAGSRNRSRSRHRDRDWDHISWQHGHADRTSIDMKHGSVMIKHRGRRETSRVEITRDYELYIDDELVKTDDDQTKLLKQYHQQLGEIHDRAKEIGWEGARIGAEGAKIGLVAGLGVLKMIFSDYSEDDLEDEVELATEKIEERAEELEEKAEEIEDMVDDLDYLTDDLRDAIPELAALDWF